MAPICDHFAQVSLTMAKAKNLVCESIVQDLETVSLTRRLFSFSNGSYFIPNPTAVAKSN